MSIERSAGSEHEPTYAQQLKEHFVATGTGIVALGFPSIERALTSQGFAAESSLAQFFVLYAQEDRMVTDLGRSARQALRRTGRNGEAMQQTVIQKQEVLKIIRDRRKAVVPTCSGNNPRNLPRR